MGRPDGEPPLARRHRRQHLRRARQRAGLRQRRIKKHGWFGLERERWGKLFGLSDEDLEFFELHEEADIEHSDKGWKAVERFARELHMEDAVVAACERNLHVWEMYLNGIAAGGDRLSRR